VWYLYKKQSMKLILTESQLDNLMEAILDEVAIPMTKKIEQGGYIQVIYLVGDADKSQTLKVEKVHGSGRYVTGVNKSGSYIVNIGGSLDKDDNTFTILKDGKYIAGGKDEHGKVKAEDVVGGQKIVVKNVTQVNVSDASKNVVDEILTNLGEDKKSSQDDSEEEREKKIKDKKDKEKAKSQREKDIYDLMVNDPILKKAFYHQPKIFAGLINFGKAKGIGPAKALISKHLGGYEPKFNDTEEKEKEKEFGDFKVNKSVVYQLEGKPIRLSYGSEDFVLEVGKNYPSRYVGKKYLKGKVGKITYKIYMKQNVGEDIYKGTIKAFFKEDDGSIVDKMDKITIKIRDYNY